MPGQPHQRGAELDCLAEPVHHAVEQQTHAVGGAGGPPAVRPGLDLLRLGVEQQRRQLDRGEPVDHAVVDLADHPDPPVVQAVGDPQLPQRTAADQRRGHHRVDRIAPARRRGRPDVPIHIELGVVDPDRIV